MNKEFLILCGLQFPLMDKTAGPQERIQFILATDSHLSDLSPS